MLMASPYPHSQSGGSDIGQGKLLELEPIELEELLENELLELLLGHFDSHSSLVA
jgi:hypothetical protein